MAIALPLLVQLFEPVQHMVEWLSGAPLPQGVGARTGAGTAQAERSAAGASSPRAASPTRPASLQGPAQRSWGGPTRAAQAHRPLRVVRVVEGRSACAGSGRMVISGRIDDVCAELDRLAALETRH